MRERERKGEGEEERGMRTRHTVRDGEAPSMWQGKQEEKALHISRISQPSPAASFKYSDYAAGNTQRGERLDSAPCVARMLASARCICMYRAAGGAEGEPCA